MTRLALIASLAGALAGAAQAQIPAPARGAGGLATEAEVVVTASTEPRSDWKRAESAHVVVLSDGGRVELVRVTRRLEQLHRLMTRLYRPPGAADDALKPRVVLTGSDRAIAAIDRSARRWSEGPYAAIFAGRGYYDPREDGELIVVPRVDRLIKMATSRRFNADCDDYLADGGTENCGAIVQPALPVPMTWESALYSTFAQRFLLTYRPRVYPRWYLDGVGALFSTIAAGASRVLDYGQPPAGYLDVLKSYGQPKTADILTGRYLGDAAVPWSPYHAWQLAHFFLLSDKGRRYEAPFRQYMTAIQTGQSAAAAALAFTDLPRLQRDVAGQVGRRVAYARTAPAGVEADDEPLVTVLPASDGALVEAQIALGARPLPDAAAAAPAAVPDWLANARAVATRFPDAAEVMVFAAEAECRAGRADECLSAAERVLAKAPDDALGLTWQGVALLARATTGPAPDRTVTLALARRALERALARNDPSPLPAIAYFRSFTAVGERAPDQALAALARAIRAVPAAPAPRLALAEELARRGDRDLARRVLRPVLDGADDSPERRAARTLFPPVAAVAPASGG